MGKILIVTILAITTISLSSCNTEAGRRSYIMSKKQIIAKPAIIMTTSKKDIKK